jgi:hypothetical protein
MISPFPGIAPTIGTFDRAATLEAVTEGVLAMRRKKMLLGSEGETAWQNMATKSFPTALSPS